MRTNNVNDVELLLSKLSKQELCEFIREECAGDRQFRQRFIALGAGIIFHPQSSDYKSRVLDIIEYFAERYGYVKYDDTFDMNRAVCTILDEADIAMSNQRWDVAIAVLEGVALAGEEIMNCGDDSAGNLGSIVEDCFKKWHELCREESLPSKIKNAIFELSISHFKEEHLKGWNWWWDWIQIAISFADTSEKQDLIFKALDDIINSEGHKWDDQYNTQTAQRYKLEMMSRIGTPEEQCKFMYENAGNPDFRRRLLQIAWNRGDYKEVLRLAMDGVSHDSQLPGLVNEWHKWELKTYRHKNDKANILKLARYFFFGGGGFGEREYSMETMYALMRSIVPDAGWNDFIETLLKEALKKQDVVRMLFIYTQEKMWDRYMEYLRNAPSAYILENAPVEVRTLYKDEFIRLYASCVRDFFQHASGRNSYREGVSMLRELIRYGGNTEADKIIIEQKNRTPRRPALINELSKL